MASLTFILAKTFNQTASYSPLPYFSRRAKKSNHAFLQSVGDGIMLPIPPARLVKFPRVPMLPIPPRPLVRPPGGCWFRSPARVSRLGVSERGVGVDSRLLMLDSGGLIGAGVMRPEGWAPVTFDMFRPGITCPFTVT